MAAWTTLTTTREDLADIRRAEFLLGRSAERASIRQLALDEAERHQRQAGRGFGPFAHKALRDFAALLEDR